jgi:hypothetical protein
MNEIRIEEANVSLNYITHDARNVLKLIGNPRTKLYWQVLLMQDCYNYNTTSVHNIIKSKAKTEAKFEDIFKAAAPLIHKLTQHHNAIFSPRAMLNLFTLDRSIVTADYTVRLDDLAAKLDQLDGESVNGIIETSGRCGMNLLILKIEEFANERSRMLEETRRQSQIKLPEYKPATEEGKSLMRQMAQDLKDAKEIAK